MDVNATVRDCWKKIKVVKRWSDELVRNYDKLKSDDKYSLSI